MNFTQLFSDLVKFCKETDKINIVHFRELIHIIWKNMTVKEHNLFTHDFLKQFIELTGKQTLKETLDKLKKTGKF